MKLFYEINIYEEYSPYYKEKENIMEKLNSKGGLSEHDRKIKYIKSNS